METIKYYIDWFKSWCAKTAVTYWATNETATLVNRVGQEITQKSGPFTIMGKGSYAAEAFEYFFTKEATRYTFRGALAFAGHGTGIAADTAQWVLKRRGYKKTGKAVGLLGNIAGAALVGGMTGGPIGAVVGGVRAATIWCLGEAISYAWNWLWSKF